MNVPINSLPTEFEQEHGSVTLDDDRKPVLEREEERLDLSRQHHRVWLCKVPKFLIEQWAKVHDEGTVLGRVRVYDELVARPLPAAAACRHPGSLPSAASAGRTRRVTPRSLSSSTLKSLS